MAAYYPKYNYEIDNEEDIKDDNGQTLQTLQDYLDDRADFVTLAMDKKLKLPYGTPVCIPELNEHFGHKIRFEIRDSGSDLDNMGFHRVDVCVRSEIDSYDKYVNRKVTLIIEEY
ncbi:uncharacterized protein LOC108744947 isoform X2 [Agrilus planipennis]|nr:uncharacterized protein LOC108744947 isoform X2 [Agrilus planipennis]